MLLLLFYAIAELWVQGEGKVRSLQMMPAAVPGAMQEVRFILKHYFNMSSVEWQGFRGFVNLAQALCHFLIVSVLI